MPAAALLGTVALLSGSADLAGGADLLSGPVPAQVLGVVDGDTIRVKAHIWLGQRVETLVRIEGIDAPELTGRCASERSLAVEARDYLIGRIGGLEVHLADVEYGKYAGRVLARVTTLLGEDLGETLIGLGFARPYDGGKRPSWCGEEAVRDP